MPGHYRTTAETFEGWEIAQIRDPIVTGPGHSALVASIDAYRELGDRVKLAADDIQAALDIAAAAHQGAAADASRQHISALVGPGDVGWAQARLAAEAVQEQADFHVRARDDVAYLADPDFFDHMLGVLSPAQGRKDEAAAAALLYQTNSNANLDSRFQAFEPPQGGSVGLAPAGGQGSGGGAAVPVGGSSNLGTAGSAPVPAPGGGPGGTPSAASSPAASSPAGSLPGNPSTPGGGALPGAVPGTTGPGGTAPSGPLRNASTPRTSPALTPPGVTDRTPSATAARPSPPFGSSAGPGLAGTLPGRAPRTTAPVVDGGPRRGWGGLGSGGGSYRGDSPVPGARPAAPAAPGGPTGPGGGGPSAAASGSGASGRGAAQGMHGMPMAGAAGAGGADGTRRRPSWLLLDDPQQFWFQGTPEHSDPVIGGEDGR